MLSGLNQFIEKVELQSNELVQPVPNLQYPRPFSSKVDQSSRTPVRLSNPMLSNFPQREKQELNPGIIRKIKCSINVPSGHTRGITSVVPLNE
jgi:hypothetical protein